MFTAFLIDNFYHKRMKRLQERIVQRAERKFERGKNSFLAFGALQSIAFELAYDASNDARHQAREALLRALAARGARADIYALRDDYGSGETDSMDMVRVFEREGVPTNASYNRTSGTETVIVRASTDSLE